MKAICVRTIPDYDLITAPTIQDALKKLITGEADAFIGDIISTSYNIKELSLIGIKPIAPVTDRGANGPYGSPQRLADFKKFDR